MPSPEETDTTEKNHPIITEIKTARTTSPTLTKTESAPKPSPTITGITQTLTKNPTIVPTQTVYVTTTPPAVSNDVISQVVNFFKSLFGLK